MTTDQTEHRAEADGWLANMLNATTMRNEKQAHRWVTAHLLAAIHDGQAEQTEWLHRIRDLVDVSTAGQTEVIWLLRALVEQATPKGDPCPCGCRLNVEPKPHVHFWKRQQNVTSSGYAMDPIEVCECGAARKADPEPDAVTVTLPRDVTVGAIQSMDAAGAELRRLGKPDEAGILEDAAEALDLALDAASGSRS